VEPAFIERRLELKGTVGVIVQFLRPVPDKESYRCDYKIIWPDRERIFHGFGIDEVQALILAMQNAHADLLSSTESKTGLLTWCDERDLGLPLAGSLSARDFI
jgi:hypothetical protein